MTTENSSNHLRDHNIPEKQRALVLQGGGALGAYEVGVLKVLCKKLHERKDGPLFDIVAGSSIGAFNAAVLVSNVVNRHKTWEQVVELLEDFWMNEKNGLASTPGLNKWWWDDAKTQAAFSASQEAARRYYSVKEYLKHGTPNVCSGPKPEVDLKFADPENIWPVYDINPFQHTIEKYSKDDDNEKLTIATCWDQRQPRLLVISVDVAEGKTVTFDSYYTNDHSNNPLYDDDGISIDHIMASGTIPGFYKFKEIGKDKRNFCDGGWLSNTPFRELLEAHRDYWVKVAGNDDTNKIPDLDVYIVNVNPSKVDSVHSDYNEVQNRQTEILYLDRNSRYDEMVAHLATDYNELEDTLNDSIGIIRKLKALNNIVNTSEGAAYKKELERLLKITEGKSNDLIGRKEKYRDLIKGKFKIHRVVRIERSNDVDPSTGREVDYSSKPADFTHETIKKLIEQGEKDAFKVFEGY